MYPGIQANQSKLIDGVSLGLMCHNNVTQVMAGVAGGGLYPKIILPTVQDSLENMPVNVRYHLYGLHII